MSARKGQGYTAWLIMLPLLIVPMIAVFGVPQLAPITAQTADGADGEQSALQLELGDDAPLSESIPPFPGGTIEAAAPSSPPPNTEQWSDPFENPQTLMTEYARHESAPGPPEASLPENGFDGAPTQPARPATPAPPDDLWTRPQPEQPDSGNGIEGYSRTPSPGNAPRNNALTPKTPAPQLTWRQAVTRLNRLGVQKFQLSQTEEPFVFQFVCDLSRPDNPRVTHRFEAKAGEPLKAVENVIQQVETWSAQQASR